MVRRLAETECALEALTDGQVDAVVDPISGLPILLREAQARLRHAYEDLEDVVRERTAELVRVNERLQVEVAERQRLLEEARLERERAERAAQLAEDTTCMLESLIEMMPVGVVIADAGGTVMSTNTAGCEILGGPVYGYIDRPIRTYTLHAPDGTPADPKAVPLKRALQTGERFLNVPYLVRRSDGEERMILSSAGVVRNSAGKVVRGVTVFQDITEHQRIADELETEQARLRAIIENAPEGIVVTDAQVRIVLHNPAARTLYNRPVPIGEDVESHASLRLCYPNGEPYKPEDLPLTRSARNGETLTGLEMDVIWPDGQRRNLLANTAPIRDEEGRLQGAVATFQDITERRRMQMDLDMERARFKAIIENAPEGIVVTNAQGEAILFNAAARAMYESVLPPGFQNGETLNPLAAYPDGGPYDPADLPLARSVRKGEIISGLEMDILWPDGQRRNVLASSAPIRGEGGEIQGAVGIYQDVTERKRSRLALIEYAERLRILHETDQAILATGPLEEILNSMLRFLQRLLGCVRASIMLFEFETQETLLLAVYSEGVTRLNKDWRGSIQGMGPEWNAVLENLRRGEVCRIDDIGHIPVDVFKTLQAEGVLAKVYVPLLAEGRLIGSLNLGLSVPGGLGSAQLETARQFAGQVAVAIQQDRLRAQVLQHAHYLEEMVALRTVALQNSMAQFQAIFESAVIGIAVLDDEGIILNSNPALWRILGYHAGELEGKRLFDFILQPEVARDAHRLYENLVAGQLNYFRSELTYRHHDGYPVDVARTMSAVRNPQQTAVRAVAMVEDIGEQKRTQKALIQSEKMVLMGRMSASFAHEINNPLQSVIGCLGLAEEMLEEGSKVAPYLQIAMDELERAAGIVHQLRDLGRSPKTHEKTPVDVNALIENILLLMRKRFEKEKVQLVWAPGNGLPPVRMMRDRMHQVYLNLFLNAIEAMPDGGELHVRTEFTPPAGVRVTITDNGVGIAADKLERIFEPFHSTRPDGLGLGLYVSKSIVDEHEGSIQVQSTRGEGTTFTIWLPR